MTELARIRHQRDQRRLNQAVYDADLHATGEQHRQLVALKQAVRAGHVQIEDAIDAVNQLRAKQHQRAA